MADAYASAHHGRYVPTYLCSTPQEHCGGARTKFSNGLGKAGKTHGTPQDCCKCYKRYLLKLGYTQIGPREFVLGDGPVILVNKASKSGTRLRGGKGGRYMGRQVTGGTICLA